jgi:hypothetical protein
MSATSNVHFFPSTAIRLVCAQCSWRGFEQNFFFGLMLVSFPVWNSLPLRDWGLMVLVAICVHDL